MFLGGIGKSGKECGWYDGVVYSSRFEEARRDIEDENVRMAYGHDLEVDAMAMARKKEAVVADGAT